MSLTTRRLTDQVQNLTRTRRGALDAQAAQLRRIERDLHDGAQARLVALSIQLGRAEARLGEDPEAAALVRSARAEAGAAISELRDLVRGIAPPVLTDRGLAAAVQSLAERCPVPVGVTVEGLDDRLPPVIESAAYFVVAESLTNVAKHAPGATAEVRLTGRPGRLVLDVADTGPGGATWVPGAGPTGLAGLRSRVEALDGRLTIESPPGGPTAVHAELPCES
jgi:signal transduction histidine kinase